MIVSSKTVPFVDLTLQHQPIQAEIEQAMATVVQRGDFILGKTLKEFETEFAQASGVKHGVGVASGTDAIALGLQACGILPGDEVLVPANTFIATVIGVIQAGATPILVDCDPHTALIDLNLAAKAITPKTKAIVPVHLYGQMVSPTALLDFAKAHNLIIFEDAAQAHLAQREGYKAGSVGMAAAFSFYPSKNLGAFGNGGMLVTSNEEVAQRVRTLRNYGAPKKYYHTEVGKNSRLDTLQAAILQVKLPYLSQWNQLRNQAGQIYDQGLKSGKNKGVIPMKNLSKGGHVYHLYVIRISEASSWSREQVQEFLGERGIQTGIHYPIPCHLQPAYKSLGYQLGDFPQAEMLCEEILSLPMYPGITSEQIAWVIEQLSLI
ncbi:DegT/DnrJ/EryC1/StrS aminotransferase family protein [Crocosphaera subtropica ATCC 51142]|uniref:DegT/DnrJ/EryC1/StrS aminotransferase family protein n=1 Tax=Crocosphaera subtropica (strain ATCC 51142 / BH68) TaxID=43989 RepID=B1WUI7_CROS5|nr:DegT/DnrJ/EryC1/StrS family aminotransferase [Crocosphaera subtropica]ACB53841.1 DegT/DnrJ/EryC1/StrS aminotransferase family protein [Crocosphaera subtropica ATCC 51142]